MVDDDLYGQFVTDRLQTEKTLTELREALHCYQAGWLSAAEEICDRLLEMSPRQADALHLSGLIALQMGKHDKAVARIGRAVKEDPDNRMFHNNLGLAFEKHRQLNEAISCYRKAVGLDPNSFEAYTNMSNELKARGNFEEEIGCYKKALEVKPDCAEALLSLVDTQKVPPTDAEYFLHQAERMAVRDMSEDDSVLINFALGKLYHDQVMFDTAFKHYRIANELKHTKVKFNAESHTKYVSRIIETFSEDLFAERQSWGSDSDLPIFIFGMPRSGTTLVEQIIATHPHVFGGGELQFFVQTEQKLSSILESDLNYPEYASLIHPETARDIGQVYVKKAGRIIGFSKFHSRMTDKNPFNFLHLGLISRLSHSPPDSLSKAHLRHLLVHLLSQI